MSKLIVFRPDYDLIPAEKRDEAGRFTPSIGGTHQAGDRILEYTQDHSKVNPEHPDDPTHCRPGPWIILDDGQCYVADIPGMQDFDEVVVYRLGYEPLPESENPWELLTIEYKTDFASLTDEQLTDMGLKPEQFDEVRNRESVGV
ncbi:hypothetical protein [Adonisia turfae]|uniref:Uncharacterized protein n=1 Tax=Adonisia turfae CCMR0081 TaxID=2292702 RepID=A0A6M0RMP3_9CYAN|nr:hypothetical protein [Adonisia turfae]NEZ57514.1 hypothetical protein [Adonisia turfae CCMR0081]